MNYSIIDLGKSGGHMHNRSKLYVDIIYESKVMVRYKCVSTASGNLLMFKV